MLALLLLSVVAGQLSPDVCWGATPVTTGLGQVGNNIATSPFPQSCVANHDVFYKYTPTCVGTATISVLSGNPNIDLRIAAFLGRSCAGLGECTSSSSGTEISYDRTVYGATDTLYFAIGNAYSSDSPTTYMFNITCQTVPVAAGDLCQQALPITTGIAVNFSTVDASPDYQSGSRCQYPDIFLMYNATCDGDATAISITDGSYNRLSPFFSGSCDEIVALDWAQSCVSDAPATWPVRNGQIYYLAVGYSYDASYSVTITCNATSRPTNDECPGALPVATSSVFVDYTNASRSVPQERCSNTFNQDLWYSYTATCTGNLVVQFNSSSTNAMAFQNCFTPVSDCSYGNTFTFPVVTGQVYQLAFGEDNAGDVSEANFTCVPVTRPSNDQCVNGMNVTAPSSQTFDLTFATTDSYTACNRGMSNDVYFRYTTCAGTNTITIENYNASFVSIAGYGSCSIDPLVCSSVGTSGALTFDTPIAVPIYLGVGLSSPSGTGGLVTVNFSCTVAPTGEPTAAPSPAPTNPTSPAPTVAPTAAPTTPTTGASFAPTTANDTDTEAPTLSGTSSLQFSFGVLFLVLATQMQ